MKTPCEGVVPVPVHSTRCPIQSRPEQVLHGCTATSCTPALRGNFCLQKEQNGIQFYRGRACVRESWVLVLLCQTAVHQGTRAPVTLLLQLMTSIHSWDWRWCFSFSASWWLLRTINNSAGPRLLFLEEQTGLFPSSPSPERTFFLPIIQEPLFTSFENNHFPCGYKHGS